MYVPRMYVPRMYVPRMYVPRMYVPRMYVPRISRDTDGNVRFTAKSVTFHSEIPCQHKQMRFMQNIENYLAIIRKNFCIYFRYLMWSLNPSREFT